MDHGEHLLQYNLKKDKYYNCDILKELRKEMGISRLVAADAMGINRSTYNYYELGKASPNIENAIRIAKFYGLPLDSFITGAEDVEINVEAIEKRARKEYRRKHKDEFIFSDKIANMYPECLIAAIFGKKEPTHLLDDYSLEKLKERLREIEMKGRFSSYDAEDILEFFGPEFTRPLNEDQIAGLEFALSRLPEKERLVIKCRFEDGMTLEEVGKLLGRTRERVRQIEAKALSKLRHPKNSRYIREGKEKTDRLFPLKRQKEALEKEIRGVEAEIETLEAQFETLRGKIGAPPSFSFSMIPKLRDAQRALETAIQSISRYEMRTNPDRRHGIPIEDLDLSVRSYNCLRILGIKTVGDLMGYTRDQLMVARNMGTKSLAEIEKKLAEIGCSLGEA